MGSSAEDRSGKEAAAGVRAVHAMGSWGTSAEQSAGLKEWRVLSWILTERKPGGGGEHPCLFSLSPGRPQRPKEEYNPTASAAVGPWTPFADRPARTLTRHYLSARRKPRPRQPSREQQAGGGGVAWEQAKPWAPSSLSLACPLLCGSSV